MDARLLMLLVALAHVQCYPRKSLQPLSKHANIDFINMEAGGGPRPANPAVKPAPVPAVNPAVKPAPVPATNPAVTPAPKVNPAPVKPAVVATPAPVKPAVVATPAPVKPAVVATPAPVPVQPKVSPARPSEPFPPLPARPTPGPGSVKQLVNFYDSQGKASVIRPYNYSQAVKQG
ncbi:unnamed protein product [Plutella xylostella]|uniref:(diamondback moth) hypothetical protein n=1 Tax=Plutella xylostella TaxID=51655 RepID=A0A8S4GAQ1_PLUXY|nr:unnamed protein product [Plutella xylostella]